MPERLFRDLGAILWRFKGTILIQIVIITIGIVTGDQSQAAHRSLMHRVGFSYHILTQGRLWHLLTGMWVQSESGIQISMIALVLSGTVVLEYLVGTRAMMLTVIPGDWIATILTVLTLRVWSGMGSDTAQRLLAIPDSGSSALAHTGLAAAAVQLPRRFRGIAVVALAVFTVAQFFVEDPTPAIVHCWAVLYGGLVGWYVLSHRPNTDRRNTPGPENPGPDGEPVPRVSG